MQDNTSGLKKIFTEVKRDSDGVVVCKQFAEDCDREENQLRFSAKKKTKSNPQPQWTNSEWDSVWKSDGKKNYFYRKSEFEWIELDNGVITNSFNEISRNSLGVLIYASDRDFYIKLEDSGFFWGKTQDNLPNRMSSGIWLHKRNEENY